MNILVLGVGKENFNYKKIEGFYNSFSKIGEVEWVLDITKCSKKSYDIVFGELSLDFLLSNIDYYKTIDIKHHIIWSVFDLPKLKTLCSMRKDVNFICAYKSNIFDKKIVNEYILKYGYEYMRTGEEGINLNNMDYVGFENLKLIYLPCSLSEKPKDFFSEKKIDICYFGTISNRPNVNRALGILSQKYNVITNCWDRVGVMNPEECFDYYKKSKITISESINPNLLEYPVRLGESTANGCRLFLYEHLPLKTENELIPEHTYTSDFDTFMYEIEKYLDNFKIEQSYDLYNNFTSTYDNAVKFLLTQIGLL
jgi:hypothetical protein